MSKPAVLCAKAGYYRRRRQATSPASAAMMQPAATWPARARRWRRCQRRSPPTLAASATRAAAPIEVGAVGDLQEVDHAGARRAAGGVDRHRAAGVDRQRVLADVRGDQVGRRRHRGVARPVDRRDGGRAAGHVERAGVGDRADAVSVPLPACVSVTVFAAALSMPPARFRLPARRDAHVEIAARRVGLTCELIVWLPAVAAIVGVARAGRCPSSGRRGAAADRCRTPCRPTGIELDLPDGQRVGDVDVVWRSCRPRAARTGRSCRPRWAGAVRPVAVAAPTSRRRWARPGGSHRWPTSPSVNWPVDWVNVQSP